MVSSTGRRQDGGQPRPWQINAGLNVSEAWNAGNGIIYFGKGGSIASNKRDEQELSVLCLWILQTALVYVNTPMIQHVLADPSGTTSSPTPTGGA